MKNVDVSRIWFASFADSRMHGALERLGREARRIGFLREHIILMDETSLDADFREKFKDKLVKGSRGYGYWCWKPQVVLQLFRMMADGDILLYLDAGCHLNEKGAQRLDDYLCTCDECGLVGFQAYSLMGTSSPDKLHHIRLERELTKGDVFDYFGVRERMNIVETGQFCGGIFFCKKNCDNMCFFRQYMDIIGDNWHLLDDSASISPNLPGFWAHRHDQSLFSILAKLHGVHSFSSCECEPLLHHAPAEYKGDRQWARADFCDMQEFPIHAMRDKTSGLLAYVPISIRRTIRKVCREVYYALKKL